MTVLITRPFTAAKRTELLFKLAGLSTWIDPVLTITQLPQIIHFDDYDALITTSANGVESLATYTENRHFPLFCVGSASRYVAHDLGFKNIFYPENPGARELIQLISMSHYRRFAYIHGETIKIDIARALSALGNKVEAYRTYTTHPTLAFADETLSLFYSEKITAITFYSEQSALLILKLIEKHKLSKYTKSIQALCLSQSISKRISSYFWKDVNIRSTTAELVATLTRKE
ncbi:MAG: uroporphyrinogen-III synthase [Candidatus Paracaedibacteraceae bacterium]|nr:uroporphyrinogen-III synthase [Candidatus Paracaedibacteraceae bacterium]